MKRADYLCFVRSFASCTQWSCPTEPWPEDVSPYHTPTPFAENIIAHHVRLGANVGMGQKPSDFLAVPLTSEEHDDLHRHGEAGFWAKHDVDPRIVRIRLMSQWIGADEAGAIVGAIMDKNKENGGEFTIGEVLKAVLDRCETLCKI